MPNFFDPALIVKGKPYKSFKYEQILKEQLLIAYLSKGAITISETNELPINDRKILLTTLRKTEEEKKKRLQEMREQQKMNRMFNPQQKPKPKHK